MPGYAFHPEALADLDEIWEYISADSLNAADRVIDEILVAIGALVPFPHKGHRSHVETLTVAPCARLPRRLCAR